MRPKLMNPASATLPKLLTQIGGMRTSELRAFVGALEGHAVASRNRAYLARRAAWLAQARNESLSDATRARLEALAGDAIPRQRPPARRKSKGDVATPLTDFVRRRDPRLPPPGTTIKRVYRGDTYEVEVLDRGFRFRDVFFTSLSTLVTRATGTRWNGFTFFELEPRGRKKCA